VATVERLRILHHSASQRAPWAKMAKGKIGTILVRLVSSAGTGYTYVKVRSLQMVPRQEADGPPPRMQTKGYCSKIRS
jgi:ribosomal protein L33